ncbi:hypothetical protein SmJEL517_g04740 [Synchytrium microbalum]|uniref:Zn(2)-C6 fungal-type domain-containing protein n=1 Tax=Synchytrium microbalum TaxID=1806994 RepID=A0A507BY45_9FUNG|nr:uncharacterized protein SmJEL517_g04740 [Synchytrium microbalum]TPX32048.1 hypothetical protein SmJEL517_g04740 [Synchytrium microbalum]
MDYEDGDSQEYTGKSPRREKPNQFTISASKKRKVSHACVYCRRSHMTCDESRPCQRCIKRKIAHLCHDEVSKPSSSPPPPGNASPSGASVDLSRSMQQSSNSPLLDSQNQQFYLPPQLNEDSSQTDFLINSNTEYGYMPPLFASEHVGGEFVAFDLLASLAGGEITDIGLSPPTGSDDDGSLNYHRMAAASRAGPSNLLEPQQQYMSPKMTNGMSNGSSSSLVDSPSNLNYPEELPMQPSAETVDTPEPMSTEMSSQTVNGIPVKSKTEKFILTAADRMDDTKNNDRLTQYIATKFEAGLLKPYNYVQGYERMSRWMEGHVSGPSKLRILNIINALRPAFRNVGQTVTEMDLVWAEEAFERHMLEYDRTFSAMGMPACLWRRTGEIMKANREFAALLGIELAQLKDGKVCMYELMTEHSAVNYWEKYGSIAFDLSQKAVLTTSTLQDPSNPNGKLPIFCSFSFTIRRDRHGLPLMIVGNFLPVSPPEASVTY